MQVPAFPRLRLPLRRRDDHCRSLKCPLLQIEMNQGKASIGEKRFYYFFVNAVFLRIKSLS